MPRSQRICLVAALGMMLAGLLVAVIGGPLATVMLFPTSIESVDADGINSHFQAAHQATRVGSWCFVLGMTVAAACGMYSLISIVTWFIGPPEKTERSPSA